MNDYLRIFFLEAPVKRYRIGKKCIRNQGKVNSMRFPTALPLSILNNITLVILKCMKYQCNIPISFTYHFNVGYIQTCKIHIY